MIKCRIVFKKTGRAKYISHLDLMRTFQHAFIRSGIRIKHTEGFNPHPYISIALPLQLGCESICELLDIQLEDDMSPKKIPAMLNPWLPEGIEAVSAAVPVEKVGALKYTRCRIGLIYDDGRAEERSAGLAELFAKENIIIMKKTKRGVGELNLSGHVSEIDIVCEGNDRLRITALLSAMEPTVNPSNIVDAIRTITPELAPDFAEYMRLEVYNEKKMIFR